MSIYTINVDYSVEQGITAFAGGLQAGATIIDDHFSIIENVVTAGDSIKLDAATVGKVREIINASPNDITLYPAIGEEFMDFNTLLGINVPITLGGDGNGRRFICYAAGIFRFF